MPYLGNRPDNTVIRNAQNEFNYTATSSQTTFTGVDTNNNTLAYNPGNVEIFFNGARLEEADFTATNGTSVVLASAASANDLISIVATDVFEATDTVSKTNGGTFSSNVSVSGLLTANNITTTGYIRGPSSFTIDPASHGDNTGTLVVAGNLQVDGTTTTINSTTMTVDDKNIVLASGAGNSSAADGAGITIDGAGATMLYTHATTSIDFNKAVNVTGVLTADGLDLGDDEKIRLGASQDLEIFHETTFNNSVIKESGSGNLVIGGDQILLRNSALTELKAYFTTNGAVELYHDNVKKLETTSAGVTVTGSITASNIAASGAVSSFNSGASNVVASFTSTDSTAAIQLVDNTGNVELSALGSTLQIQPSGGAATAVFLASGSVGIGGSTITDVNLLNIQGDGSTKNVGIVLNKTNSTAQIWSMQVNNTTGGLYFHNYTASNTPVAITTSGNVGIGTNNPADKMHIYNSSGSTMFRADVNANSTVGLEINKTGSTTQSWKIADGVTHNGALQFYDSTDSAVRMHIDGAGNIGINTTAPGSRKMRIVGSSASAYPLALDSTDTDYALEFQRNGVSEWWLKASASSFKIHENGSADHVTVLSGGKVGIGTSSPQGILHLDEGAGDDCLLICETHAGGDSAILWTQGNSGPAWAMGLDASSGTNDGLSIAYKSDGFPSLTSQSLVVIDTSGNVGIGTTNPSVNFEVNNSGNTFIHVKDRGSGSGLYLKAASNGDSEIQTAGGNNDIGLRTSGNLRMKITSSGDVKIGNLITSASSAPLFVAKSGTDVQAIFGDNNSSIDDPSIRIIGRNTANNAIKYTYLGLFADEDYGYLGFNAGAGAFSYALNFNTSGQVGIGTGNPTTYAGANGGMVIYRPGASSNAMLNCVNTTGSGTMRQIDFFQGTSTGRVGSIESTTTFTNYNSTSDRRLKENIMPIQDATQKILAMNPVSHTWINDKTAPAQHGFIAQEMQSIVPEAVSGDADSEEMMQMDYGKITPVIVKSLQDALKEISSLKQRISDLEKN